MNNAMNALRGARILMTGGLGFIGSAMLEYFKQTDIDAAVWVTSRKAHMLIETDPRVHLLGGTSETCTIPDGITHIVHLEPDDINARGYATIIGAAQKHKAIVLYASSGIAGTSACRGGYARRKTVGEFISWAALHEWGVQCKIARLWSFVGPYLPLDSYAIGNFIRDGLNGGPIIIKGNGKAIRSYLYTTDLAEWMWTILLNGRAGEIYNVGSEDAITIGQLARKIALKMGLYRSGHIQGGEWSELNIDTLYGQGEPSSRYVPDTSKTRGELGLVQKVGLDEAIAKTIEWNRKEGNE